MADTTTFLAQISSSFWAFWAYVFRFLSLKPGSGIHSDDLEAGIPSDSVEREVSGHFNMALPVVSGSRSIDGFVDISLNPDNIIKEAKVVPIAPHISPTKASIIDTEQTRNFEPTVKIDRPNPVLFPGVTMITQVHVVDNRSKHRAIQFAPSFVRKLPQEHPNSKSRKRSDSISDLLDQFPAPPMHIPLLLPAINRDVFQQTVEKTGLASGEICPSPTISEELTVHSSSGSSSILSTDPSISTSDETPNTSVDEVLQSVPCTSAVLKVLSSGIDVKDKNMTRLTTLIHNPETSILPITDVRGRPRSKSLCTFKVKALPETYHDVVDRSLQNGDISKDMLSKEREKLDTGTPIHNLEHSSLDKKVSESVRAPVQDVPAVPTTWTRPVVAPLRIVKKNKNKVQSGVVPLEPLFGRRVESENWEQAMDNVLQAFRDAEMKDHDFRDLFYKDDSFFSQSSVINHDSGALRDDRDGLDDDGDSDSIENLSMRISVSEQIMEVKNEVGQSVLRHCDCEGFEDSYSWTAETDDEDDNHSQENDQWSDKLELDDYVSSS